MPAAHTCPRCGGPATPIIGQYVACAACDAARVPALESFDAMLTDHLGGIHERIARLAQLHCTQPGYNGIAVLADSHCPPDYAYLISQDTWTLPADAEPPAIAAWLPAGPPQPMFSGPTEPVHGQSEGLLSTAGALYWVSGDGTKVKIA
jgi:hypothetical protein